MAVRLAHPLYGEVLRAGLPPLRLRRVQAELADIVEAHGARRREDVVAGRAVARRVGRQGRAATGCCGPRGWRSPPTTRRWRSSS